MTHIAQTKFRLRTRQGSKRWAGLKKRVNSERVSNGLSGKRKFRVFEEVINEYDQLPHHCGEG